MERTQVPALDRKSKTDRTSSERTAEGDNDSLQLKCLQKPSVENLSQAHLFDVALCLPKRHTEVF